MILYIRRRDPRYLLSESALDPESYRLAQAARVKADLLLAAKERAKERERQAELYEAQSWQKSTVDPMGNWGERSGEEGEGDSGAEGEEQWCVACARGFMSGGAWENHERSRKHKQNLERSVLPLSTSRRAKTNF